MTPSDGGVHSIAPFRPGPEIAGLTGNRISRDPGSAGRQVNAEPAGTILGNRQPPLSPDGPQSQEPLQPVRRAVPRRLRHAARAHHPRYRRHRRGDPRAPGERLLPRLLRTPLFSAPLCLLRPPSPARPTPTRQHRWRQGCAQPDPPHRRDDPGTLAQCRHRAARRQRLRAREPDALVRGKCRGLRLRPGSQRCPAQESTEGPRQGRHGHEPASRSAPTAISTTSPNPEPGPGPGASSPRSNTSPDTNSAAASSSPPWIATKSRPGNSTKTPGAHAATWKTASRTANSICSPIA